MRMRMRATDLPRWIFCGSLSVEQVEHFAHASLRPQMDGWKRWRSLPNGSLPTLERGYWM